VNSHPKHTAVEFTDNAFERTATYQVERYAHPFQRLALLDGIDAVVEGQVTLNTELSGCGFDGRIA